ncbi:hypothetical protein BKA69DRAFT_459247 [Paraphysoderma sedebokerense]|nr:hypothetical protein BKA69DRAFT_459247 [Paraphysoderma sedebokerense]
MEIHHPIPAPAAATSIPRRHHPHNHHHHAIHRFPTPPPNSPSSSVQSSYQSRPLADFTPSNLLSKLHELEFALSEDSTIEMMEQMRLQQSQSQQLDSIHNTKSNKRALRSSPYLNANHFRSHTPSCPVSKRLYLDPTAQNDSDMDDDTPVNSEMDIDMDGYSSTSETMTDPDVEDYYDLDEVSPKRCLSLPLPIPSSSTSTASYTRSQLPRQNQITMNPTGFGHLESPQAPPPSPSKTNNLHYAAAFSNPTDNARCTPKLKLKDQFANVKLKLCKFATYEAESALPSKLPTQSQSQHEETKDKLLVLGR